MSARDGSPEGSHPVLTLDRNLGKTGVHLENTRAEPTEGVAGCRNIMGLLPSGGEAWGPWLLGCPTNDRTKWANGMRRKERRHEPLNQATDGGTAH